MHAPNPGLWAPASTWTPSDLGASLYAWWDASRADLITQSGGLVSSWKDIVAGYDAVQAVGASKPTYSATGFGGLFPAVSADGVDDELTYAGIPANIPVGAAPVSEEWFLVDQQALFSADTGVRVLGSYGGAASGTTRRAFRIGDLGANRFEIADGPVVVELSDVEFSDRHVVRVISTGSTVNIELDGLAGTPAAQTATISSSRLRFFANALTSAANFGKVAMAARLFTAPLSAANATRMYGYLNKRK